MSPSALTSAAASHGLAVLGGFRTRDADTALEGMSSVLLLGPSGPEFWDIFSAAPEMADGAPDPMNRWSERIVGRLAEEFGGKALYPFGGPPWLPFYDWALRSGQAFASPIGFLVHGTHGLFVSYRGALGFAEEVDLPTNLPSPCETCADRPCLSACPVGAFSKNNYDTDACHGYLDQAAGSVCMSKGCAARRACPIGQDYRLPAQSAFHMAAFHKG